MPTTRWIWLALVACTAALAAASTTDAGWRDVLDTPALKSPLAARVLLNGAARAGTRIVAVGQRGHVVTSDDGGTTWVQADVPVSSDLVAVAFPDAMHGWAVGHDGVVLHSADAGRSWKVQLDGRRAAALLLAAYDRDAPAVAADDASRAAVAAGDAPRAAALRTEAKRFAEQGAENPLLDVWFRDASHGFVVGAFGLALRTVDGGATWEPWLHAIDNPKGLHLYAVRGFGDDVFMVGEQGLALKLDHASGGFRSLELPYKGTLFGLAGHADAIVAHGLRGTALRSTDGGSTWQAVATGLQVGLTAGLRSADGRLVLVSQAGHVLVSRDDGASFAAAAVERPVPAAAVVDAPSGALVVAGPRGAHALTLR